MTGPTAARRSSSATREAAPRSRSRCRVTCPESHPTYVGLQRAGSRHLHEGPDDARFTGHRRVACLARIRDPHDDGHRRGRRQGSPTDPALHRKKQRSPGRSNMQFVEISRAGGGHDHRPGKGHEGNAALPLRSGPGRPTHEVIARAVVDRPRRDLGRRRSLHGSGDPEDRAGRASAHLAHPRLAAHSLQRRGRRQDLHREGPALRRPRPAAHVEGIQGPGSRYRRSGSASQRAGDGHTRRS